MEQVHSVGLESESEWMDRIPEYGSFMPQHHSVGCVYDLGGEQKKRYLRKKIIIRGEN